MSGILGYTGRHYRGPFLVGPERCTRDGMKLVLDGAIENRGILRARLLAGGVRFVTSSDAELVACLIAGRDRGDLLQAVHATLPDLRGRFALVAMSAAQPGLLVGACHGASLVVGGGPGNQFVASSAAAFQEWTTRVHVLAEGDVVALSPEGGELLDRRGRVRRRVAVRQVTAPEPPPDFRDQPQRLARTLITHLDPQRALPAEVLARVERVRILGCGGALNAGLVGRSLIEEWAGVPVEVENATEERYRPRVARPRGELVVGILRPGETADTLAAMRIAREQGATVVALTTSPERRTVRDAHFVLLSAEGLEAGVHGSRTFLCEVAILGALALRLGEARGVPSHVLGKLERRLREWPEIVERTHDETEDTVRAVAARLSGAERILFVGRGAGLAPAHEGRLKLQAATRAVIDVSAGGELRHGPLGTVSLGTAVVALATAVLPKLVDDLAALRARGAHVTVIASERDTEVLEYADDVIWLPVADPGTANVVATVALDRLAQALSEPAAATHSMVVRDGGDDPGSASGRASEAARVSRPPLLRPR